MMSTFKNYQEFIITYLFPYNSDDDPGQTKFVRRFWQKIPDEKLHLQEHS